MAGGARVLLFAFLFALSAAKFVPVTKYGKEKDRVSDTYIVLFGKEAKTEWNQFKKQAKSLIKSPISDLWEIGDDFRGFGGRLTTEELEMVQTLPGVEYIEQDQWVFATGEQLNVQAWGIDRSDQVTGLNQIYRWRDDGDGTGATVYILDTGILTTHVDFNGRARFGVDCMTSVCIPDVDTGDVQGHGTHCAGSAASTTFGIAKNANLVNVRVLGDNGSSQGNSVISGVNWAAQQNTPKKILSMSLGSGFSAARNEAVNAAHRAGSVVVVAAGNSNNDACTASPASAEEAVTVASIQQGDRRSGFSSYGSCVNIFAPGSSILSTTNNGGTGVFSGTSMATPHVAGAAALIHSRGNFTADEVREILYLEATEGIVIDAGPQSPNRLLYTAPGF